MSVKPAEANIRDSVAALLARLSIAPEQELQFRPEKFYFVLVGQHVTAGRVIVKIRFLHPPGIDATVRNAYFGAERQFYQHFRGQTFLPTFVTSGSDERLAWLVYSYLPGRPFGTNWLVRSDLSESVVTPTIAANLAYSSLGTAAASLNLTRSSAERKLADFAWAWTNYQESLSPYLSQSDFEKINQLGRELTKSIDRRTTALAHGDLHPENIFFLPDEGIKIIDWETVHLDLPSIDLVRLWIRAWNIPWRDRWLRELLTAYPPADRTELAQLWRFTALTWLIGEFPFWDELVHGRSRHELAATLAPLAPEALAAHQMTLRRLLEEFNFWERP